MEKFKSYSHQRFEFEQYKDVPGRGLFWTMRLGKSKAIIDLASHLYTTGQCGGVLILAPSGVHSNWVLKQVPLHIWDNIDIKASYWNASIKAMPFIGQIQGLEVFSANFDGLTETLQNHCLNFVKRHKGKVLLVLDESHAFGNPKAIRTIFAKKLATACAFRRLLSGTPVLDSPLKAYTQLELIKKGGSNFTKFSAFKEHYANTIPIKIANNRMIEKITGYKNLEQLSQSFSKVSTIINREDVKDLPKLITEDIIIPMPNKLRAIYKQVLAQELLPLASGEILPALKAQVLRMKLRQIASGFIKVSDNECVDIIPHNENPRLQVLENLLTDKCIIWCNFSHDIKLVSQLLHSLKVSHVEYHGKLSQKEQLKNLDTFTDGKANVFLGQPQAAGLGLDLSIANEIIWYSHVDSLTVATQANERATQIGSHPVCISNFIMEKSIDDLSIFPKRVEKEEWSASILKSILVKISTN